MPNPNLSVAKDVTEQSLPEGLSVCPKCGKTQVHTRTKRRTNIKGYVTAETIEQCKTCGSTKTIMNMADFGYNPN